MGVQGLQFETVAVAFTQGADTRTQRKLVVPGKWDDLLNYTLSDDNTPQVRDGHAALVATANGNGLATYNAELLTINGGALSSVSTAAGSVVARTGRLGHVGISKNEIRRSTGMQDTPDCATGGGFTCYVWREKSAANAVVGINCTLVDESTGARLISNQSLRANAAVFGARVVFQFNAFFIFYIQGTSLYCRTILAASPTVVNAEVALITSASLGALNFDACAFGKNGGVMVSYAWGDGTRSIRTIEVVHTAGVPSINSGPRDLFTEAQLPAATITGICCAVYSNGTLAGTFVTSTGAAAMAGLAGAVIDDLWAVATAATQIDNAAAATTSPVHVTAVILDAFSGIGLQVFWDRQSEWATNALNPVRSAYVTDTLVVAVAAATIFSSATFGAGVNARGPQGPFIAGKAFTDSRRIFLPVFVASVYNNASAATANPRNANTQNTFFLMDCNAANSSFAGVISPAVVAKALYGSFGQASINGNPPAVGTPCSVFTPSSGAYGLVATELTQLVLSGGINVSPTGLVRLNMEPNASQPASRLQLGESTYVAGGSLASYDGANVVEHGFPLYPEGVACTPGGAGTGSMTDGVHQVVTIYEWVDNAGQRHQSGPSLPVTVTVNSGGANTGSIAVQVPTLLLSQKTDIFVVAFVTTAAGLIFFRALVSGAGLGSVANTTAATTVTVTITSADATLAGNEPLYTQPNQAPTPLANIAPGPCSFVWPAQGRLFFDKADKPGWYGYSQPYVNNVGLQFAPELEAALPTESGGFVAGAALDEKVIVFGRNRIYVQYGNGPQTSGAFNNYSQPQDIGADVGCLDPLSVLSEFPGGIIFKSQKGFCVLQRDLSVKYIGDGVSRFDANTVTAAVLLEDRHECRFVTSGTAGSLSGTTLVYSYLIDQWSWFSQTAGDGYLPVDGIWWDTIGRYVTIALTQGLNKDTPGVYTDQPGSAGAGVGITTRARTGWLHLTQLEGFQRVKRLLLSATAGSAPSGSFIIAADFNDLYVGTTLNVINLALAFAGLTAGSSFDLRWKLPSGRQKCKSVSFTFVEAAAAGAARLNGIQALALEVGRKRGVLKLRAAQSS